MVGESAFNGSAHGSIPAGDAILKYKSGISDPKDKS